MATVEELRDELLLGVKRKDYTWLRIKSDALIAAAREEGAAEGYGRGLLGERSPAMNYGKRVSGLERAILVVLAHVDVSDNLRKSAEGNLTLVIAAAEAHGFEKGKAEGAEQEKVRIVTILDEYERHHVSIFMPSIRKLLSLPIYDWHTQTSTLSPAPKEEK